MIMVDDVHDENVIILYSTSSSLPLLPIPSLSKPSSFFLLQQLSSFQLQLPHLLSSSSISNLPLLLASIIIIAIGV